MNVKNLTSHSGREVPNQFEIRDDYGNRFFQSYQTIIVKHGHDGQIYLDRDSWDCSQTTGKYRNLFLGESKKETERKIASGEYVLCNLN